MAALLRHRLANTDGFGWQSLCVLCVVELCLKLALTAGCSCGLLTLSGTDWLDSGHPWQGLACNNWQRSTAGAKAKRK